MNQNHVQEILNNGGVATPEEVVGVAMYALRLNERLQSQHTSKRLGAEHKTAIAIASVIGLVIFAIAYFTHAYHTS